jgi:hypothetical protein
MFCHDYWNE